MASNFEFGETTTGIEVAEAFSNEIRGKYVLIVGVSPESIGAWMATSIAKHDPALLILASRTRSKIDKVITSARKAASHAHIEAVQVDLSSQISVRSAAQAILDLTPKLDIVINNAGVNVMDHQLTPEGIELHFGTNHIGLFLLTNLILEKVRKGSIEAAHKGSTRIINVASSGHRLSPIRFSDINFEKMSVPREESPPASLPLSFCNPELAFNPFIAYGQSKTANILFSRYLIDHLGDEGILSFSVHPGSIWTGLARHLDDEGTELIRSTGIKWRNADQGASTALVAALDPVLNEHSGLYWADCHFAEAAPYATDKKIAERLWDLSEKLVGQKFQI